MLPFITLSRWLFSKVILISLIIVVLTSFHLLKKSADGWIKKQEIRTSEAQEIYDSLKDKAGPQYSAIQDEIASTNKEIRIHKENLVNAANDIKQLNEDWKGFTAFWIPGGYNEDDWYADKAKANNKKAEVEVAIKMANEKLEWLETQADTLTEAIGNDKLEEAKRDVEREQGTLDDKKELKKDFENYTQDAWEETKALIGITIILVVFGPFIWKIFCFWIIGGFAKRFRYVHVSNETKVFIHPAEIGESCPALKIPLEKNETLIVKERFLQASKENVSKKTEYVWNWKYPFLSLVAGLVFLTKIRTSGDKGVITLSCDDDPAIEVIRVDLQENEEMVIRPGFLVGYLFKSEPLKIKTVWNFQLQSWMTLKFRNFLVKGEGSIFLSAGRGFNDEKIESNLIVDRDIPVLWNPSLGFKARRAETFWSYALGRNSLFDDEFHGKGRVLCQQVRGFGGGRDSESIWGRVFGVIGKVFGL